MLLCAWSAPSPAQDPSTRTAETNRDHELQVVYERLVERLLSPAPADSVVAQILLEQRADGSWPGIDYEDESRTGFQHSRQLNYMVAMGRAYAHAESRYYRSEALADQLHRALDFWLDHDFMGHWWNQEIGTPERIMRVLLLFDRELTDTQRADGLAIVRRASLDGVGARPGGDLIKIASIIAKRAVFEGKNDLLDQMLGIMAREIHVTTGRGLQPDMSFHHRQEAVNMTMTYGLGYPARFTFWAGLTRDTRFALPEDRLQLVTDFYLDGISRHLAHGTYRDPSTRNRAISSRVSGLYDLADTEILADLVTAGTYRREELEHLYHVRTGRTRPNYRFNSMFWRSDNMTHQRPGWFVSVRMFSDRRYNVEKPYNSQGLKNHHLNDGSHFILRTGREYVNVFAAYDWQNIPGTTVVQQAGLNGVEVAPFYGSRALFRGEYPTPAMRGITDFVGGLSDGMYGVTAFDFSSPHHPLKARKARFFFDEGFVALGTGISSRSASAVITTLNQSALQGPVQVALPYGEHTPSPGAYVLDEVQWVHHDSTAYVFEEPVRVHLRNRTEHGNWRYNNHHFESEPAEAELFTLWLNHGIRPQSQSYAYYVLPGIRAADVPTWRDTTTVRIVANEPEMQAVSHDGLRLSKVVFYEPGNIQLTESLHLRADSPCVVMVRQNKQGAIETLSVADPSQQLSVVHLWVSVGVDGFGDSWQEVAQEEHGGSLLRISLPDGGYAGSAVHLPVR